MFKPENDIQNNYWFTLNREDVFKYTGKNFSPYIIYLSGQNDLPKTKSTCCPFAKSFPIPNLNLG